MKTILSILLFITLNLSANETYEFKSRFGFLSEGSLLSSFKDARIALKVWLEEVSSSYMGQLTVDYYNNSEALYEDLKNNKLDMIVIDPLFFFKNKNEILSTANNIWSLSTSNYKYKQYYLISQKINNAKNFKNIYGKTISLQLKNDVARVWLDKSSLLENKKSCIKVVKELRYVNKETTALLNVFFKKTDFAIINKETWDVMIELNPSISRKLEVVSKSQNIYLPFIGLFSKKANEDSIAAFF